MLTYPAGRRPDRKIKTSGLVTGKLIISSDSFGPETFVSEFSGWPCIPRTLPRRVRLSSEKVTKFLFTRRRTRKLIDKIWTIGLLLSTRNTIRTSKSNAKEWSAWSSHRVKRSASSNALTKSHGYSVTKLKFFKIGQLSIVDEDKESAERRQLREVHGRNLRPHRQQEGTSNRPVEWEQRYAVGCAKTIPGDLEHEANLSTPRLQDQF